MKLHLSRRNVGMISALGAVLLGVLGYAILPGEDPMLEQIAAYAAATDGPELALNAQLENIRKGQSVNVADDEGYTPLMNAVRAGNEEAVDYLLIKGARLHRKGPGGRTAADMAESPRIRGLLKACAEAERNPSPSEKEQMRQQLRASHINPDDLTQALFDAVQSWHGDSVMLTAQVLALGGNANAVNADGKHILEQRHRDSGSMVILLRHRSNPDATLDSQGCSQALLNNINRNPRNVRNLLTRGASVKGANALAKAAGKGNAALLRQMLKLGAKPHGIADNGKTVLEHAVQGLGNPGNDDETEGIIECVRILLEKGCKTEYTPKGGKTRSPLSPGGMSILPECLRLLVDAEADVNALNSRGANYAQIAAYKKLTPENLALLKDIIAAGANLKHVDDKGETFLFYALPGLCALPVTDPVDEIREEAEELLDEMLDIIEDSEADPAALDRNGNTALHLAVIRRGTADDRVVEFLLRMGVAPGIRNKFGRTALEAMLRNPCGPRSKYVARLLSQKGPLPTDAGLQLVLASMMDDTDSIRALLKTNPSPDTLAVALGCVQNATAADLLLKAKAPCYSENIRYMVRYGNPDVVRIFASHNRLKDLAPHWDCVRTEAMAKAFIQAGLKPTTPAEIANEKVLGYLLTLPDFPLNGSLLNMAAWRDTETMLAYMVKYGRKKMTRMLLEQGAAVNGHEESLMALAEDEEIAGMLLDYGVDLTQKTASGDTLLSARKARLKELAKGYTDSPTRQELEQFRSHYYIARLLEKNGVSDIHPRRDEIKRSLQRGDENEQFETVEFVTPGWTGPVRISEDAMVMARASGNSDTANILSISPDKMRFKWDRWGYGFAIRKPDGKFHQTEDTDRYRDLKQNPTKVPHIYFDYTDGTDQKARIYLHPDKSHAVHADNRKFGKVIQFRRGHQGSIYITWESGELLKLALHKGEWRVLSQASAKELLHEYRPGIEYREIKIASKDWSDTLRISTEYMVGVRRSGRRDTANILKYDGERLILKWDKWGTETFIKQADGVYHISNARMEEQQKIRQLIREGSRKIQVRRFRFSSRGWSDTVLISFKHKVAVRTGGQKDSASVVRYDKDSITLKWDRWAEETFARRPDGSYHSTKHP